MPGWFVVGFYLFFLGGGGGGGEVDLGGLSYTNSRLIKEEKNIILF